MRISQLLNTPSTKPMQIVEHKDFSRASWLARSHGVDTPIDSMLRGSNEQTAMILGRLGL